MLKAYHDDRLLKFDVMLRLCAPLEGGRLLARMNAVIVVESEALSSADLIARHAATTSPSWRSC